MAEHSLTIVVSPTGGVTAIAQRSLDAPVLHLLARRLGDVAGVERGGWVLPASGTKRVAFRALRALFGDGGAVAAWTRRWRGPWIVAPAAGERPLPESFTTHAEAVKAEAAWLLEKEVQCG